MKELKKRWLELWQKIEAEGDPIYWIDYITTHWCLSDRFYHSIEHLKMGLEQLDQVKYMLHNPETAEIAWWLHDVICNPRRTNNEEQSAAFAKKMLTDAGLAEEFKKQVEDIILATKHLKEVNDHDAQFIADIDTVPLGWPQEQFAEMSDQIQKEYDWVPTEIYRQNRTIVLQRFFNRQRIYYTDFFQKKYGTQAKKNLEQALSELNAL